MLTFPPLFWRSKSQNAYNYSGANTTLPELQGQGGLFTPSLHPSREHSWCPWGWKVGPAALHRNSLKKDSPTAHISQNVPREHKQTHCQLVTVPALTWPVERWHLWQPREVMQRAVPATAKQRNAFWNQLAKNSQSQLRVILCSYIANVWYQASLNQRGAVQQIWQKTAIFQSLFFNALWTYTAFNLQKLSAVS